MLEYIFYTYTTHAHSVTLAAIPLLASFAEVIAARAVLSGGFGFDFWSGDKHFINSNNDFLLHQFTSWD